MANRFWVGGTASWTGSNTTNWSTTSGGAGGASVPGAGDVAIFDANSGGGTVTKGIGGTTIGGLDMSAAATMTFAGSTALTVNGNVAFGPNVTYTYTATMTIGGSVTITGNGATITFPIALTGDFQTKNLGGDFTSTSTLTFNGASTLNTNNHTIAVASFSSSNGQVCNLGSSTINLTGTGEVWSYIPTQTVNAGTSTINITNASASAATFSGGGYTYNNINVTAGTGTRTLNGVICNNLDFTGFAGSWANNSITVMGNLTLATGMTVTAGTGTLTLGGSSGTQIITTNGITVDRPVTINAAGATKQLAGALVLGSSRALTITNGIFNANVQSVTAGSVSCNNSNTRSALFGGSAVILSGTGTVWNFATTTGLSFAAPASIKLTAVGTASRTFSGGGLTYNDFWNAPQAGTELLEIVGSNTFADFKDDGTATHAINFQAGSTTTVSSFTVSGNPGQLITIASTGGASSHTLVDAGGTNDCDYLAISFSNAIGGATWNAGANSIDSGNNTGWVFPASDVGLDAPHFDDADAFIVPVLVDIVAIDLTAPLYDDADAFFAPAVDMGDANFEPALFDDADVFFIQTVTPDNEQAVTVLLLDDADAFFLPAVTAAAALTAPLHIDADAFFAPTVLVIDRDIAPALYVDTDTCFLPIVGGGIAGRLRSTQVIL